MTTTTNAAAATSSSGPRRARPPIPMRSRRARSAAAPSCAGANPEPSPFVAAMRRIASETSLQREAPPVADPTPSTPVQAKTSDATAPSTQDAAPIHELADQGLSSAAGTLPHLDEHRRRDEQEPFVPATHTQSDAVAPGQVSRSGQLLRRANPEPSPFVAAMRSIASETSLQREALLQRQTPPVADVADPTPSTPVQLRSAEPRPRDDGAGEVDDHLRAAMGLARRPPAADAPKAAESESLVPSDGDAKPALEKLAPHGVPALATGAASDDHVHEAAHRGVTGAGSALPHGDAIQRAFGRHDVSSVKAHVGGEAATASRAIGAEAYATGNQVAFAAAPSLHTAAHEAAHVVQQRAGVHLKGGVGETGDPYERHANDVADAVVQGKSAETLLDQYATGSSSRATAVQRQEATSGPSPIAATATSAPAPAPEREATSSAAPDAGSPAAAPAVEPATKLTPDDVAELILRRPDSRDDFLQWAERVGGAVYRDKILAAVEKHRGAASALPPAPATAASAMPSAAVAAATVQPPAATAAPAAAPAATPAPSSPAMTFPASVRVTPPDGLRVRRTASKESDDNVAGGLHRDAVVTALAREGDWLRIEYQGAPAYVFAGLVAPVGSTPTAPAIAASTVGAPRDAMAQTHNAPTSGHDTSTPPAHAAVSTAATPTVTSNDRFVTLSGNSIAKTTAQEATVLNALRADPRRFDPAWLVAAQRALGVVDATGAMNTETLRAMRTRAGKPSLDAVGILDNRFLAGIVPGEPFMPTELGFAEQAPDGSARRPADLAAQAAGYASYSAYKETWVDISFLGRFMGRPNNGGSGRAHPYLAARLRVAEAFLRQRHPGLDDEGVIRAVGWSGSGNASYDDEPTTRASHQHTMGLAIDIDPAHNPYIFNENVGGLTHEQSMWWIETFKQMFQIATRIYGGDPIAPATLVEWSKTSSTEELFQRVKATSDAFAQFLVLSKRPKGEILAALIGAKYSQVDADGLLQTVQSAEERFHSGSRNRALSLTTISEELILALRDAAGLAWGGTEMSPRENGDFMHFDCRQTTFGTSIVSKAPKNR